MTRREVLDNGTLRAEILPEVGGTIASLRHLGLQASVLGEVPWDTTELPDPSGGAADEAAWLSRFGGGWPLMFPNAGDACVTDGTRHGFHGEASVSPWQTERQADALILRRRFMTVPAAMTRCIRLAEDRLVVEEEVRAEAPCTVMWGQHVTFGTDLLAGPVRITSSAGRATACDVYAPPESPLRPGAAGAWPMMPGRDGGKVDLSRPGSGWAALACLDDLGPTPWVTLQRFDDTLAARLEWTPDPWPLAWLWIETGGTGNGPWFGRGNLIGVEPGTTWPATGLAGARAAGGHLLHLVPGTPHRGRISIRIFRPDATS